MLFGVSIVPKGQHVKDDDASPKLKKHKDKHKKDKRKKSKAKHKHEDRGTPEHDSREDSPKPARSASASPVRVAAADQAADRRSDTPPQADAAPQAQGDEFDAIFGAAEPRTRSKQSKDAASKPEPEALPVGLQQRGSTLSAPQAMVGDGGASWRMKALKRAQQRAAEEGRPLDDEVRQRYASAAELTGSLAGARHVASDLSHLRAAKSRRGDGAPVERGEREDGAGTGARDYLRPDTDDAHARMKRPVQRDAASAFHRPSKPERGHGGDSKARAREDDRSASHRETRHMAPGRTHGDRAQDRSDSQHGHPRSADRRHRGMDAADAEALESAVAASASASDSKRGLKGADAAPSRRTHEPRRQEPQADVCTEAAAEQRLPEVAVAPAAGAGGNLAAAAALRARLRGTAAEPAAAPPSGNSVQILPQGRAAPGAFGREAAGARTAPGRDGAAKLQRYADGQKVRYFRDDDTADLATLVKRAKHGDDLHDMDAAFAANVAADARYRGKATDVDDEYDVDGGLEMFEDRRKRGTREQQQERQQKRAVSDAKRFNAVIDRCQLCFASATRPKDLLLSIGRLTYMALPARGSLAEGHVVIAPTEHVPSFRAADEDVFEELKNFRKCLIQMFAQQGKHCLFMETATRVTDMSAHASVECVPVSAEAFARAPLVFKQEIGESESEWSQHHAKRVIDTSEKGLRRSVPVGFPYFHVEFGYRKGFVHVIDDENKWSRGFGRSVVVGLIGSREEDMYRRARKDSAQAQQENKATFLRAWDQHDWTKQLD